MKASYLSAASFCVIGLLLSSSVGAQSLKIEAFPLERAPSVATQAPQQLNRDFQSFSDIPQDENPYEPQQLDLFDIEDAPQLSEQVERAAPMIRASKQPAVVDYRALARAQLAGDAAPVSSKSVAGDAISTRPSVSPSAPVARKATRIVTSDSAVMRKAQGEVGHPSAFVSSFKGKADSDDYYAQISEPVVLEKRGLRPVSDTVDLTSPPSFDESRQPDIVIQRYDKPKPVLEKPVVPSVDARKLAMQQTKSRELENQLQAERKRAVDLQAKLKSEQSRAQVLEQEQLNAALDAETINAQKVEAAQLAAALDAERLRSQSIEAERLRVALDLEALKNEQAQLEIEKAKIAAQALEVERVKAAKIQASQLEAKKLEERLLAEQLRAERLEADKLRAEVEAEKLKLAKVQADAVAAERVAQLAAVERAKELALEKAQRAEDAQKAFALMAEQDRLDAARVTEVAAKDIVIERVAIADQPRRSRPETVDLMPFSASPVKREVYEPLLPIADSRDEGIVDRAVAVVKNRFKGASPEPAQVASLSEPQLFAVDVQTIVNWNAKRNHTLRSVLQRWSQREGVQFVWQSDQNFDVKSDFKVSGSFEQAVQGLLDSYAEDGVRPLGHLQIDPASNDKRLTIVNAAG